MISKQNEQRMQVHFYNPKKIISLVERSPPEILKHHFHSQESEQLTDQQITIVFRKMTSAYYDQQTPNREWLDWLGQFLKKYGQKQYAKVNKVLANSLSVALLNAWTHFYVYQNDEQKIKELFQTINRYLDDESVYVDSTLSAISLNNQAVFEMTKGNYLAAYQKSRRMLKEQEQIVQNFAIRKGNLNNKEILQAQNLVSVLMNTYLIICKSFELLLKQTGQNTREKYQYEHKLATYHARGLKVSNQWLDQTSLLTKSLKHIVTTPKEPQIHIIKPKQLSDDLNMGGQIIQELQTKIEYMVVVVTSEQVQPQKIPNISQIMHQPSQSSIHPNKDLQLIKQISSFDELPVTPVAPSPVYSACVPVQFPTPNKQSPVTQQHIPTSIQKIIEKQEVEIPIIFNQVSIAKTQEKVKMIELMRHQVEPGMHLVAKLYDSKSLQLTLSNNQKQLDSIYLSEEELKRYTCRPFAAPYPLDYSNAILQEIVTFYILPYCFIQSLKLVILSLPRSIIPVQQIQFLGQTFVLRVCFIQLNEFRVILSPKKQMPERQQNHFVYEFKLSQQEADDKLQNYVKSMITHPRVKNLLNKYHNFQISSQLILNSRDAPKFYQKKTQSFISQVLYSITLIEKFMKDSQLQNQKNVLYVYRVETFQERSSINAVREKKEGFLLNLQNYLKLPGKTVTLSAKVQYPFQDLYRQIGQSIHYSTSGQKSYVKYIICDRFRLRNIRKDFVEEDYKLYCNNPLDRGVCFLEIGFRRKLIHNQNNSYYILTTSLVCNLQNHPLGVKINFYNPQRVTIQNVFLPLSKYIWIKQRKVSQNSQSKLKLTQAEKRKLKKKLFLNQFPVVTNFNISYALTKGGFLQILQKLNVSDSKIQLSDSTCSRLENNLLDDFH